MDRRYVHIDDIAEALNIKADYLSENFYDLEGPFVDLDSLLNGDNMTLWDLANDQGELLEDIVRRIRRIDESRIHTVPDKKDK